jgi:hypothetical protein
MQLAITVSGSRLKVMRFSSPCGWWMPTVAGGGAPLRSQPENQARAAAGTAASSCTTVKSVAGSVASKAAPLCEARMLDPRGSGTPLASLPGARQTGLS